jgi:hypothetical protein
LEEQGNGEREREREREREIERERERQQNGMCCDGGIEVLNCNSGLFHYL